MIQDRQNVGIYAIVCVYRCTDIESWICKHKTENYTQNSKLYRQLFLCKNIMLNSLWEQPRITSFLHYSLKLSSILSVISTSSLVKYYCVHTHIYNFEHAGILKEIVSVWFRICPCAVEHSASEAGTLWSQRWLFMFLNMGEVRWGEGGACAFDKTRWKLAPLEIFKRDWKAILQESGIFCALCWLVARLTFLMSSYILICSILKYILSYISYLARSSFSIEEPILKNFGLP